MKNFKIIRITLVLFIVSGFLLNSCKKDEDPEIKNEFLFSSESKFTISAIESKIKLSTVEQVYASSNLIGPKVTSDVEVYKIVYKTTFKNNSIQASGLVCLPKDPGDYPILCFQNGTNTEHSKAPSEDPRNDLFGILESVASTGFIVVVPDYLGFGASAQIAHPYLHAESTTQSILDMLRAVNELGKDEKIVAKPTKDLYIFGYSQGGWATMQLQKAIEKNYSSEFNLIASSCAAGPYRLDEMNKFIVEKTEYPMPYFLTYLLNAYVSLGLVTNPISDFIQEPYAAKISSLYDGKNSGGAINSQLTTQMASLLTADYRTGYDTNAKFATLKSAFQANSVTVWNISTPTRLYHAGNDEYIPVSLSQKMYADFLTSGVPNSKLELKIIPGFDHPLGVVPVGIQTVIWFLSLKK
jgi:pimeloyl-ACP methyl ester carboxylesterase